jgi:hypothetical protein
LRATIEFVEAEKEVAPVNCDVADFLSGMTLDPNDPWSFVSTEVKK